MAKRGRPTTFTEAHQAQADEYIDGGYEEMGHVVPTVAGLALALHNTKQALYDWAKIHPGFSYSLRRLNQKQEQLLVGNGLAGVYNSAISKLILSNHGYREKTVQEVTGAEGGPVNVSWVVQPVKPVDQTD